MRLAPASSTISGSLIFHGEAELIVGGNVLFDNCCGAVNTHLKSGPFLTPLSKKSTSVKAYKEKEDFRIYKKIKEAIYKIEQRIDFVMPQSTGKKK